jgi:hypothetical protein
MNKTTLKGLFEIIESDEFAAKIGVASRFSTLEDGLKEHPAIQFLLKSMAHRDIEAVTERLLSLCCIKVDDRYTHPWDLAITSYLWILWKKQVDLSKIDEVIAQTDSLWWGRYLADYLRNLRAEFSIACSYKYPASVSWDFPKERVSRSVSIEASSMESLYKEKDYKRAA